MVFKKLTNKQISGIVSLLLSDESYEHESMLMDILYNGYYTNGEKPILNDIREKVINKNKQVWRKDRVSYIMEKIKIYTDYIVFIIDKNTKVSQKSLNEASIIVRLNFKKGVIYIEKNRWSA